MPSSPRACAERFAATGRLPCRARPPWPCRSRGDRGPARTRGAGEGGDHDAFTILLDVRLARLDAAARLILRDPELARDAVQEASIRAWRDLPGLRDPDRFDAWVHRLTVHSCLDIARRRRRRVIEVELEEIDLASSSDLSIGVA